MDASRPSLVPALPEPTVVEPALDAPNDHGVRRFVPPRGEEILSVSTSPDGEELVAVTGTHVYPFDATGHVARVAELPGVHLAPVALALSGHRAAVLVKAPIEQPEGRLYLFDTQTGKLVHQEFLGGVPALGVALAGDLFAVVLSNPPAVVVYDAAAKKRVAEFDAPAGPRRVERAADGSWAALATTSGVMLLEVDSGHVAARRLELAFARVVPQEALPIGDVVLVTGREGGAPVALVVPRRGGEPRRLAVGSGNLLGMARSADGSRAIVFGSAAGREQAYVFDSTTWAPLGAVAAAPTLAGRTAVAVGSRLIVPRCHDTVVVDPTAMTVVPDQAFPSPQEGPCLDGLYLVGARLFAREGSRLLSWTLL